MTSATGCVPLGCVMLLVAPSLVEMASALNATGSTGLLILFGLSYENPAIDKKKTLHYEKIVIFRIKLQVCYGAR